MSAPRVLGYDDLHEWLDGQENDAMVLAAEYGEQGDDELHHEELGRAEAFGQVRAHIEYELRFGR